MELRLRPYAAAGVAVVGASAIALAPVAPPLPDDIKIANPAVSLSATIDPITPWAQLLEDAGENVAALVDDWAEAPFPVLQQVIVNQLTYLNELPDFELIVNQIVSNLEGAARAPFVPSPESVDPTHAALLDILPVLDLYPPDLQPLIDFAASPVSGILLGLAGPVIAPLLALSASVQEIVENITSDEPNFEAALNTLINIPAGMADAFLNGGQTLNLTPVLDALGVDLELIPGLPAAQVGLTFGGLLSGSGSIVNALDIAAGPIRFAGQGPGAIGSLIGLTQSIARALGWDGTGNPLEVEDDEPSLPPVERQANDASVFKASTTPISVTTTDEANEDASGAAAEETPAPSEEPAEESEGASPVVAEDESDDAPVTKPATKKVNPGAKIAGALKNAGDQIGNAVNDLGKRLTKRPTKKAPAAGNDSASDKDSSSDAPANEKASDDAA